MENLPDQTKQNSFIKYGKFLAGKFLGKGKGRNRRTLAIVSAIYFGLQLIPSPFSAWYSVKTNHGAIVTDEWTGKREIKGQGNHMKNIWGVPVINSLFTKIDEHLLTEHIWFFRNSFKKLNKNPLPSNVNNSNDTTLENYVDVSSKDLKQTLVKVGIKYKINDLEKFAVTRMGRGLDGIDAHDRPYILTGNEFDTSIFSAVQSKNQDELLKSTGSKKNEVQKEILGKLKGSDIEERYGISITAIVYDARLVLEVARANAEKQRDILLGEGFRGRADSGAEAWHKLIYGGLLNISDKHKDYNKSIIDLANKLPNEDRARLWNGIEKFTQWNVIKERDKDTLIPYGQPYVLPQMTPPSKK